jgi:ribosomal protein S18 acetylase RimI-like enzyme
MPAVHVEPLNDRHDRNRFSSEVEPLDRYFRTQAGQDVRKRVASCFVLVGEPDSLPIGFYTLAATSIALTDLPTVVAKRLPRYPSIPATLMGRLAVDAKCRRKGFGELLLFDAFSRTLRSDIATHAFVVDAKDNAAVAFYKSYRFLTLTQSGLRMFLPMAEVAKLFS